MPATARIDDSVLDHLKVDKTRPAQDIVSNSGGGGGSSGSSYRPSSSQSSGGSGVAKTITDWATAGSAIQRFRGGF
jgi:hypothetical protein